jgi:hypothetical protein
MRKSILVLVAGMFFCGVAAADLAPPRGYVETCTVEKEQKKDEVCTTCRASRQDRQTCKKNLEEKGYTKRCRAHGANVWTEVWCKKTGM